MLELKDICYGYNKDTIVLNKISLKIESGKFYVILGENGSGKSTLLMLMKGIHKQNNGEIYFKDKLIKNEGLKKNTLIHEVGFVFQDPDVQILGLDVRSDIEFGLINLNYSREQIDFAVEKVMEECDIAHLHDKNPYKLSYGEKKRVSIAGVLAMNPDIIMLDEPTTWLDPWHKNRLKEQLFSLNKAGKGIVLSTHDMEFARSLNCNYIFMKKGKILKEGGVELLDDLELLKECRLL